MKKYMRALLCLMLAACLLLGSAALAQDGELHGSAAGMGGADCVSQQHQQQ